MVSQKARATVKATDQKPDTTAMATASMMPTATVYATSLKWRLADAEACNYDADATDDDGSCPARRVRRVRGGT